ncbi:hypothetical protein CVN76_13865 [Bacillus sp. mrc49]|nr:hypothetical protein CVN76_13865 [Bacillus sp. mrc49]
MPIIGLPRRITADQGLRKKSKRTKLSIVFPVIMNVHISFTIDLPEAEKQGLDLLYPRKNERFRLVTMARKWHYRKMEI